MEKRLPPFWHPFFDSSEVIFGSDLLKGRSPLCVCFALFVPFLPQVFWVGPFERSKPLGIHFALTVLLVPKVFWFGPF